MPILNFLLLVLEILSNAILSGIYKSLGISKTLLKKSFKLNPRQKSHFFASTFLLILIKANPTIKKKSSKKYAIKVNSASNIEIIFVLLAKEVILYI